MKKYDTYPLAIGQIRAPPLPMPVLLLVLVKPIPLNALILRPKRLLQTLAIRPLISPRLRRLVGSPAQLRRQLEIGSRSSRTRRRAGNINIQLGIRSTGRLSVFTVLSLFGRGRRPALRAEELLLQIPDGHYLSGGGWVRVRGRPTCATRRRALRRSRRWVSRPSKLPRAVSATPSTSCSTPKVS